MQFGTPLLTQATVLDRLRTEDAMRWITAPLIALLALASCGEDKAREAASSGPVAAAAPAPRIDGAGWLGTAVDPAMPSGKVRALAFFKPG
jgi:hypothetical protein